MKIEDERFSVACSHCPQDLKFGDLHCHYAEDLKNIY